MKIKRVIIRRLQMRMKEPFETSFGREEEKDFLLVRVDTGHSEGYGECTASLAPLYSEETTATAQQMLTTWFVPALLGQEIAHPDEVRQRLRPFRRNQMAKAALETAIWDAFAKEQGLSLAKALGGNKAEVQVGISVGIQSTTLQLLEKIEGYLLQGYKRIKVKIRPGWDLEILRAIRKQFPEIALMADANSAYRLQDLDHLIRLDEFGLTMIEQPLAHDDIIDHAALQAKLQTPICLDESIHSTEDAKKAIAVGACQVINVKVGRLGGLTEARELQALCAQQNTPVWCGGMLEAGVGRLTNLAVTSLPGFVLPGDTAPSARYFDEDIIDPPVCFVKPGIISVPEGAGIGAYVREDRVEKFTVDRVELSS
ncbi:o-succinylbenzoate synthase [Sulfoacidibacillus thermotolerans]|uniref:o-succinylbenzoate synthase n=1 Tax=Sulfoacidibacillus thermotolerans TaxID=1765684 RepID=A0A2U3D810_SULT2|nr:o-succinylbenzoate synthase [Sulfoacidibacillus thermotolerans]PWI57412.1 o-succinylbenzoate synthase [Sulfoacidibacillus thermotolerans]